eukprot:361880-Chlamydomonas_euryale.AAC.1
MSWWGCWRGTRWRAARSATPGEHVRAAQHRSPALPRSSGQCSMQPLARGACIRVSECEGVGVFTDAHTAVSCQPDACLNAASHANARLSCALATRPRGSTCPGFLRLASTREDGRPSFEGLPFDFYF